MPWALRSVMPRLAAMSRSLAPGSWAMHSSTRAWLVRKLQVGTLRNLAHLISGNMLPAFGHAQRARLRPAGACVTCADLPDAVNWGGGIGRSGPCARSPLIILSDRGDVDEPAVTSGPG